MIKEEPESAKFNKYIENFRAKVNFFRFARENYLNAYQKDPLAKLFVRKFRLSPIKSGLLGLGTVLLTYLIGCIQYLWSGQEVVGITRTILDFIYDLYLIPMVYGYYIWVSTRPPYIFLKLQEDGISFKNNDEYNRFVTLHVNYIINSRYIYILSFIIAFSLGCLTIYKGMTGSTIWGVPYANPILFYFFKVPITWGIPLYMVCVIFLKETMSVYTFRKLLNYGKLNIDMFHKDKCGGLKPISDYLLTFVYFIVACGLGLVYLVLRSVGFGYFKEDIIIKLALLGYLGITYFFFYFPLHPVHKVMKKLKEEIQTKMGWEGFLPVRAFTPSTLIKFTSALMVPLLFLAGLNFL